MLLLQQAAGGAGAGVFVLLVFGDVFSLLRLLLVLRVRVLVLLHLLLPVVVDVTVVVNLPLVSLALLLGSVVVASSRGSMRQHVGVVVEMLLLLLLLILLLLLLLLLILLLLLLLLLSPANSPKSTDQAQDGGRRFHLPRDSLGRASTSDVVLAKLLMLLLPFFLPLPVSEPGLVLSQREDGLVQVCGARAVDGDGVGCGLRRI